MKLFTLQLVEQSKQKLINFQLTYISPLSVTKQINVFDKISQPSLAREENCFPWKIVSLFSSAEFDMILAEAEMIQFVT